ncbi:MAG: hypothetical protein HFI19_07060 [Lachnospiraceae bacterium]|jgi:hypothetical protein|nr:hypothetical protein [Lachnospiraceae bacterium]
MRKFLKKIVIFFLLFACSGMIVMCFDKKVMGNQFQGSYQAAMLDKTNRLQSIDGPKIILIGNSNVCFGINSAMIEEHFSMPVVNMGLAAGLGNAFLENMLNLGLSEGDIVVVCHSDFSNDDTIIDLGAAWKVLEHHKELWSTLRKKDYFSLAKAYPSYFFDAILSWAQDGKYNKPMEGTSYSRNAFNEYGDIVKRYENTYTFHEDSVKVPQIDDTCIDRLNRLNRSITEQGATLIVAGYPIADGAYTPEKSEYEMFEAQLRERLECDIISHYTDYFIPYEYFYDSDLHLTEEGAKIRTEQLIQDLDRWGGIE